MVRNQSVVPAQPGFCIVYPSDTELFVDEAVVAWLITLDENGSAISTPIGVSGTPVENWFGVLQPDGQVVVPADATYANLEEAQNAYRANKVAPE